MATPARPDPSMSEQPGQAPSSGAAAAAAYLRERPALDRVLREAARKYVTLGRLGGLVRLESAEEAFAVGGLRCRVRRDGRVALTELDESLRERTRFGAGLVDTLEAYLGTRLVTRREALAERERAWEEALARAVAGSADPRGLEWVEHDLSYLKAQWRSKPEGFADELGAALAALGALPHSGGQVEIPVLAHRLTGDPHALDPDRSAGRFLERLLVFVNPDLGLSPPLGAEDRETLFALAGLVVDEVSSTVAAIGLAGGAPLLEAARAGGQVLSLPLRTVYEVLPALEAPRDVYAVENPSVLSAAHRALRDRAPEAWPTVVCTSGHLSLAAVRLLDALVGGGARLHYSGDFDPKGLMIARALAARYGAMFVPWRFDAGAHRLALGSPGEAEAPDHRRTSGPRGELAALARQVQRLGPAYQEGIVELLVRDVVDAAGAGGSVR